LANKILSVFVDESGTFSNCESHDDKYVVGLVFHDQGIDISSNIRSFKDHLKVLGKENHFVHTAPLIRRESPYENDLMSVRFICFSGERHQPLTVQTAKTTVRASILTIMPIYSYKQMTGRNPE
jgi:hypothetical protein